LLLLRLIICSCLPTEMQSSSKPQLLFNAARLYNAADVGHNFSSRGWTRAGVFQQAMAVLSGTRA
jgi:hypothetical protein